MIKKQVGHVIKLFISKEEKSKISLDKYGVIKDKFYAKNQNRSVLIASQDSYNLALNSNIIIDSGSLGENILLNYNPYSLSIGSKLYIGEVILEITQHCTICNSLAKLNKDLPILLKNDRGIFSKIIQSGYIKVDDKVWIGDI
ncbi:MAG TPA: MOSC domain-containing protein [Campylobacterales bacterium]|nr:MOSC domain-containing protein [Campylobacterales bacterium]